MSEVIECPSPNQDERSRAVDMIVLHYTGMESAEAALERLCDPAASVSAHYLITETGSLYRLVEEDRRAWHAGVSYWRGRSGLNHCSVGIELVNPGHEFGYRPFPARQIDRLLGLLDDIRSRHTIEDSNIIGHSDVAPDRKCDPGELFPWDRLAASGHGIGLPDDPGTADQTAGLEPGDRGPRVAALKARLASLGYLALEGDSYDRAVIQTVTAFQRHWRQHHVSGHADQGTLYALDLILSRAGGAPKQ